jgi:hypothetical protein
MDLFATYERKSELLVCYLVVSPKSVILRIISAGVDDVNRYDAAKDEIEMNTTTGHQTNS